jgi:hypothetical protein
VAVTVAFDSGAVVEVTGLRRAEEHQLWPAAADALVPHAGSDACAFYPGVCLVRARHPQLLEFRLRGPDSLSKKCGRSCRCCR